MRSKKRKGREKTESFYFFSVKKYDYCDHQNMKMHLVLYYSNPNKKPQWGQILYKNAWRSVNFEMSFWCLQFSKKMNKNHSTWGTSVIKSNFFICFLGEFKIPKNIFEINWPLAFLHKRFLSISVFSLQNLKMLLPRSRLFFKLNNRLAKWHENRSKL